MLREGEIVTTCAAYLDGAAVLRDWLGDGARPVHASVSEKRGSICGMCPKNQHPKWWETATQAAAETIRAYMAVKSGEGFVTPHDEDLGMCVVCKCCLPLKVHTPLEHILAHTSEDVMAALPEHCWVKTKDA